MEGWLRLRPKVINTIKQRGIYIMRNFKSFLNESVENIDAYKESVKIVEFLSKKIGQNYVELDGQNYTNSSGNYFGYLFVSKTDNSAIRINWEGTKFHSINFWITWDYVTDPTKEIFVTDTEPGKASFAKILPDIANIIKDTNSFDEEDNEIDENNELEESMLTERKVEYKGNLYTTKNELVIKLYEDEIELEDIRKIVRLDTDKIKTIIAKYLYSKGGSVSEIAEAIDVDNIMVRNYVNSPDEEETVKYDEKIKILKGAKETIVLSKLIKNGETKLENIQYADPDMVFDEITDYVTMVAKGLLPSLLITGQDEIGKSYNVEKVLNRFGKINDTWVKVPSKYDAEDVYELLWKNRNKIVVFEDNDSLLKDPKAINIIKQVIKSTAARDIDWVADEKGYVYTADLDDNKEIEEECEKWSEENKNKEGIPNHFIFEGQIIFITKLSKTEFGKKDEVLLDKCTCIDIITSAQGNMKRLETILPHLKIYKNMDAKGNNGKDITDEDIKYEVFDFMNSDEFLKNPKVRGKEINFRTFDDIYKLRYAGLENWKDRAYAAGG